MQVEEKTVLKEIFKEIGKPYYWEFDILFEKCMKVHGNFIIENKDKVICLIEKYKAKHIYFDAAMIADRLNRSIPNMKRNLKRK